MTQRQARVAIIDGGGANIASLQFALARLGAAGELTVDPAVISSATHVILPGVGAARSAMARLRQKGLASLIPQLTQPVLGICLGLQLLYETSEEDDVDCLGVLAGGVRRFVPAPGRPVPHMGWNQVMPVRSSPLLANVPANSYFYFVHSYAAGISPVTTGSADYGWQFSAVVESRNFLATQFHPERSGPLGARVLGNFLACH
ncbi:MAG: imidazole glycerol phosphate synthase subunit HisH [Gammaproteobacteria bacterium]|nr:imidazole glycerol phosphate synthase subunit HisH [Gammaproteobacteria bacterium]